MYPRPIYSGGNRELVEKYKGIKRTCNFFKDDIEGYSYFMGFCYADSHMEKDGKSLQVYSSDKEILEKLIERMKYTGPLLVHRNSTDRYKTIYRFNLGSKIAPYFNNKGLINNKKNVLLPEDVNIYHFLRGFLDGDGTIHLDKRNGRVSVGSITFLAMNKKLLEQIRDIVGGEIYNHKNGYMLEIANKEKYLLLDNMYKDATIFLERKYNKYKEIGSIV